VGIIWFTVQGLSLTYPSVKFWDDYLYYADDTVLLAKNLVPNPGRSQVEAFLLSISPGSFRVLSFFLMPICALLYFRILGRINGIVAKDEQRLVAITFLLYFPWALSTMVSLTLFNYVLALTGFLLGWNAVISANWILRWLVAPLLFLFSFRLPSLIVFSAFPLTHSIWIAKGARRRLAERGILALVVAIAGFGYFPVLEFFGFTFKTGYNEVLPSRLAKGLLLLLFVVISSANLVFRCRKASRQETKFPINVYLFVILALLMFGVAAFPYLITGHLTDSTSFLLPLVPGAGGYSGRHLLLFAFPFSVITAAATGLIKVPYSKMFSQFVIATLTLLGVSNSIAWRVDAVKQQSVIQAISQVDKLTDSRFVFVDDQISSLNAMGRDTRSYEREGWVKLAGGHSTVRHLYPATSECRIPISGKTIQLTSSNQSRILALIRGQIDIDVSVRDITLCRD
jgi:hypothetical protein